MDTCRHGHPWEPSTTYIRSDGRRECRICRLASQRRWLATHPKQDKKPRESTYQSPAKLRYTNWLHIVKKNRLWLDNAAYAQLGGCRQVTVHFDIKLGWIKLVPTPDVFQEDGLHVQLVTRQRLKDGSYNGYHITLTGKQQHALHRWRGYYFVYASDGKYWIRESKIPSVARLDTPELSD